MATFSLQDADLLRHQAFIGGRWCDADDSATFDVTNPATGETLGTDNAFFGIRANDGGKLGDDDHELENEFSTSRLSLTFPQILRFVRRSG